MVNKYDFNKKRKEEKERKKTLMNPTDSLQKKSQIEQLEQVLLIQCPC